MCFDEKKKKVENGCPLNPHTDLCRHKYSSKFSRSRKKIGLLLNSEERLKRLSFLEATRIYLNKVKYLHIRMDIIKPMFKTKYIYQYLVLFFLLDCCKYYLLFFRSFNLVINLTWIPASVRLKLVDQSTWEIVTGWEEGILKHDFLMCIDLRHSKSDYCVDYSGLWVVHCIKPILYKWMSLETQCFHLIVLKKDKNVAVKIVLRIFSDIFRCGHDDSGAITWFFFSPLLKIKSIRNDYFLKAVQYQRKYWKLLLWFCTVK